MTEGTGSTAIASAVFLSLVDFSKLPVAEQARLKERLESITASVIAPLAEADRVVLDALDGLAIVCLGPADAALDLGERLLRKAQALPIRIGINHGPIKLTSDARGEARLVGDGLAAAATITSFAARNRLLVSRSFRDALADVDSERAENLLEAGTFTDAQVRAHEVYAPNVRAHAARRRRLFFFGGLGIAGLLGTGIVVRAARRARARRASQPAIVELAITPAGEVFVDGERKGRTPPLRRIEVAPGRHKIEVRAPGNPPVTLSLELAPSETAIVQHDFPPPRGAAPKSAAQKAENPSRVREFFRDLRRQMESKQ